jgi:hypothetical protein
MGLIDPLAEFFARLEMWHALSGHRDQFARFGIAPHARGATIYRKRTKAADLDALPPHQGGGKRIKKYSHGDLAVSLPQL